MIYHSADHMDITLSQAFQIQRPGVLKRPFRYEKERVPAGAKTRRGCFLPLTGAGAATGSERRSLRRPAPAATASAPEEPQAQPQIAAPPGRDYGIFRPGAGRSFRERTMGGLRFPRESDAPRALRLRFSSRSTFGSVTAVRRRIGPKNGGWICMPRTAADSQHQGKMPPN